MILTKIELFVQARGQKLRIISILYLKLGSKSKANMATGGAISFAVQPDEMRPWSLYLKNIHKVVANKTQAEELVRELTGNMPEILAAGPFTQNILCAIFVIYKTQRDRDMAIGKLHGREVNGRYVSAMGFKARSEKKNTDRTPFILRPEQKPRTVIYKNIPLKGDHEIHQR